MKESVLIDFDVPYISSGQLIAAAYSAILGRNPDPVGLANYGAFLRGESAVAGAAQLMRTLISCPEGMARLTPLLSKTIFQDVDVMSVIAPRSKVDHFISLGAHCITSGILKDAGKKRWSGPLDWVFSSPAMAIHCLEDGFSTFLDRNEFDGVPLGKQTAPGIGNCNHRFYKDRFGIDTVFNHRDPTVDGNYHYYRRSAARMMSILANDERKVMVMIANPDQLTDDLFFELSATIGKVGNNCELIAFRVYEPDRRHGLSGISIGTKMMHGDDRLIDFYLTGQIGAVRFNSPLDNVIITTVLNDYHYG